MNGDMPSHPRRRMVYMLRRISHEVRSQVARWNQSQSEVSWPDGTPVRRKLTDAERVENQPAQWRALEADMEDVIRMAFDVRNYARQQAAELEREDQQ